MKVLLVEDDQTLARNLHTALEHVGFAVDTAHTAVDGLFQATEYGYDCIVLDIMLPDGNGFDVCAQLRKRKNKTPIVMMTVRDGIEDRVRGLDTGADDYVSKPVDSRELVARVRALIRRNSKEPLPILRVGDITINPQTHRVVRKHVPITFSAKEFAVLEFLARHSDEVVSRSMIMEHVWGSDFETFSNVVDVYIRNLRRKIDVQGKKRMIHTIRGGGYSFSDTR